MNERGFSPILALVSVGVVTILLACPEVFFMLVATVFSIVFVVGMILAVPVLFIFSCYCLYQILKELGKMLR